ncbi:hypothetical protein [Kordiimonas laminariae]|uniref:hypothetical protein n=1 Tax=Kordiimonas laminariae TaxID=2917717 RepID=UPI001FF5CB16|nr:hypothetical protein [Kordiimonas laminariae]MCK0069664.1 hypothetical protein [Kordiimonas laminariae]
MLKKKIILIAAAVVTGIMWCAMIAGLLLDVDNQTFIYLVTATAIVTEIGFWVAASVFGVAVFQARRKVLAAFMRPFRSAQ